jgi:hypothetical protein
MYLELTVRRGLPLASLDGALKAAAAAAGVAAFEPRRSVVGVSGMRSRPATSPRFPPLHSPVIMVVSALSAYE